MFIETRQARRGACSWLRPGAQGEHTLADDENDESTFGAGGDDSQVPIVIAV